MNASQQGAHRPPAARSDRRRAALYDGLTGAQREVVLLIVEHLATYGRPPTYRWLMLQTGILSPNGIACHVRALAKKGWIERDHSRYCGLRLCGLRVRLECDGTPAGRGLARLLGRTPEDTFEQGGGI